VPRTPTGLSTVGRDGQPRPPWAECLLVCWQQRYMKKINLFSQFHYLWRILEGLGPRVLHYDQRHPRPLLRRHDRPSFAKYQIDPIRRSTALPACPDTIWAANAPSDEWRARTTHTPRHPCPTIHHNKQTINHGAPPAALYSCARHATPRDLVTVERPQMCH